MEPEGNIHHEFALSQSPIGNKKRLIDSQYVSVRDSSADLGWSSVFVSDQLERPYNAKLYTGSDILVSLIRRGHMTANIRLGEFGKVYSGGPGRIAIIPDHSSFDVELSTDIQTTHFYIKRSMLDRIAEEDFGWNGRETRILPQLGIIDSLLVKICHSIRDEMRAEPQKSRPYVESMTRAAIAHLLRRYSNVAAAEKGTASGAGLSSAQFEYIKKLVKERLSGPITIDDLVRGTDLSRDHFIRLFRRQTGITPYQYIISARVKHAGELLEQTDMSIAQIAQHSGFADQVHLTRTFQRHFGEAPGAYRRKTRNIDSG